MANTNTDSNLNAASPIDITPDMQVKQLTYGNKIYSTPKLSGILQNLADRPGKAIMYDMEIMYRSQFPLRFNNYENNSYVIVYDQDQQTRSQTYNYEVGSESDYTRGKLPLQQILSFETTDENTLALNVDLTGSYGLPWKNIAEFSLATGNLVSLSSDKYDVFPSESEYSLAHINVQPAILNKVADAFGEAMDVRYVERTECSPLSIAFADANTYTVALELDKIKSDILYDIQSDQLNAYNKTVVNVADPELPTDAVNKQWIVDILRDYALTSDITSEGKPLLVSVTYSELMNMIDSKQLVPGQQYKITDYEATINGNYIGKFTLANNVQFDIIVTADSEDGLNENARAELHNEYAGFGPGMQRNDKPWKWQLKYTVYNDQSEYAWADPDNGKGVVYWLKDEFNNEAFFDFKNIDVVIDDNTFHAIGNQCRNCIIKDCADGFETYDIKQNVICDNCINVQIGEDSDNVRVGYSCKNVIIGYQAANIRVDDDCESIRIGDNISDVDVESGSCKKYIDEA